MACSSVGSNPTCVARCRHAVAVLRDLNLEFEVPFRELGFHGVPHRTTAFVMPTVNCLVELIEMPFTVITVADINLVNLERVGFNLRNFDMTIVFKAWPPTPLRLPMPRFRPARLLRRAKRGRACRKGAVETGSPADAVAATRAGPDARCDPDRRHPVHVPGHGQGVADEHGHQVLREQDQP